MDVQSAQRSVDHRIAELASRQHGVVARAQIQAAGLGRGGIEHRLLTGRLHPVRPGIYAVGHPLLGRDGRWMAAVLACGEEAVLSHRSAAALWRIRPSATALVEVTIPTRGGQRRRPGIAVHRSQTFGAEDVTRENGIPVTAPARTLLDLAGVVTPGRLERAADRAEALRLFDLGALQAALRANPGRPGAAALAAILERRLPALELTRSELEERFLELCADYGLPRPQVNARVEIYEVDFLWPERRLIVETDGRRHHLTTTAFERDRDRDARLLMAGYRVLRFTYRQVTTEPAFVLEAVRSLLDE